MTALSRPDPVAAAAALGAGHGWTGRVQRAEDVERVLESVNDAGRRRPQTQHLGRAVEAGSRSGPQAHAGAALAVPAALATLLPDGLRRGAALTVVGSTSLLLALLGAAMNGSAAWCAVAGMPSLGAAAATEHRVDLERLVLVPYPGSDWPTVVAALIDGVDVVVVAPATDVPEAAARTLTARARQRGCVLVSTRPWPGAQLTMEVTEHRWHGLGNGHGRLRDHEIVISASGRGAAARRRELTVSLPSPDPSTPPARAPLLGGVDMPLTA
jgi:hypothetical protein